MLLELYINKYIKNSRDWNLLLFLPHLKSIWWIIDALKRMGVRKVDVLYLLIWIFQQKN